MGGSQALSRSLFAQLIPKGKEAEYFSIYEVSDKGTSWMSPLVFGLALQLTHSYRQAILSLIIFFIAGLVVLTRVDVKRGERWSAQAADAVSRLIVTCEQRGRIVSIGQRHGVDDAAAAAEGAYVASADRDRGRAAPA